MFSFMHSCIILHQCANVIIISFLFCVGILITCQLCSQKPQYYLTFTQIMTTLSHIVSQVGCSWLCFCYLAPNGAQALSHARPNAPIYLYLWFCPAPSPYLSTLYSSNSLLMSLSIRTDLVTVSSHKGMFAVAANSFSGIG